MGYCHPDDDEFPQVGFVVDMGEPWQFYGLQNGTADNYKNYDQTFGRLLV